jgi:hypothetical protein
MNSDLGSCIIVSGKPEFFQMDLPGRKRMLGSQEHRASYREAPGVSLEMLHFQPKNTAARTGKAPGVSLEMPHFQPKNTAARTAKAPGVSLEKLHFQPKNTAARTGKAPGVSLEKLHFQPTNTATPGKLQASAWRYFTFNPKHVVRYVDG